MDLAARPFCMAVGNHSTAHTALFYTQGHPAATTPPPRQILSRGRAHPTATVPANQLVLLAILAVSTFLYIVQWVPIEVIALLTIAALLLTGTTPPEEALSGFSSSATVTVGAMFVISAGVMRTGAMESITARLVRWSGGSQRRLMLFVALFVVLASGFMNNTPLVVLMIPVMLSLGKSLGVRPSKLLLPVAYLASLGGTITLIGTSTNILVGGLYRELGGPGLGLFEMAPMGLAYAAVGTAYVLLVGPWLLPDRAPLTALTAGREGAVYISEVNIGAQSTILDRPVHQVFSRIARVERAQPPLRPTTHRRLSPQRRLTESLEQAETGVELLELVRSGRIYRADETRHLTVQPGDTLLVAGTPRDITALLRSARASLASVLEDEQRAPARSIEQAVIEAIVLPNSTVNGRMVGELGLHHLYGVAVMGVQRFGQQRFAGMRDMRLTSGDVLLLQGEQTALRTCCEATNLLIIEGVEQSIARNGRRWVAVGILAALVLLASFSTVPIVTLALTGALLMVLTGCLRPREALDSLDSSTLLLLAGTIPLGVAMERTGLAQSMVDWMLAAIGVQNPWLFVALLFGLTWFLTELLSNNAVAVLLTPIVISLSRTTGINETALIMVVIFGASASFTLPQGYQTNAMVMGPGGYRFIDYIRFGLPLSLLCWLAAGLLIPIFWPLTP